MSIVSKSRSLYAAIASMLRAKSRYHHIEVLGHPTEPRPHSSRHKQGRNNSGNTENHFLLRSGTGLRERNRRVKQMFNRTSMLHAICVAKDRLQGEMALILPGRTIDTIMIQADNLHLAEAYGWHESPAGNWAVN